MRIEHANPTAAKGWYCGPWNSQLPISIGYANEGIDEPHAHTRVTEIYMAARGTAQVRVRGETITVHAGDILVIEPGEAHTFLGSSPDYFHFVVHAPGMSGEAARAEKVGVARRELGL